MQIGGDQQYYYRLDYDKDGNPVLYGNPREKSVSCNTHMRLILHVTLTLRGLKPTSIGATPDNRMIEKHCSTFQLMFRCFYRQPVTIRSLEECTALVLLANQYEAVDSIADSIRASFFEWPELDVQIKESSTPFLVLGYKLKSVRIFKEAFIHVVGLLCGRHDKLRNWAKDPSIPEPVIDLVREECSRLVQLSASAIRELQVIGLNGIIRDSAYHRVAVAILRDALGVCWANYRTHGNDGALFRMITNCRYEISDADIRRYQSTAHITNVIGVSVPLAAEIRKVVSGLVRNNLRLKEEMDYLTCAELSDDGLPWLTYIG